MVSAAKAFEKEPPKKPLTNLKRIAKDFKWRYKDRDKTDQVVRFCADAPDFATAVRRAVEARDAVGKHHNHQSKVDITARRKFGAKIIKRRKEIERLVQWSKANPVKSGLDGYSCFDAIHDLLDEIKPRGIGPVTVYDVATRVGAYLGIEPESVYLHAGVKQGIKALEEKGIMDSGTSRLPRVPMYLFPPPWDEMKADDVEDMLCTYREVFESWQK